MDVTEGKYDLFVYKVVPENTQQKTFQAGTD